MELAHRTCVGMALWILVCLPLVGAGVPRALRDLPRDTHVTVAVRVLADGALVAETIERQGEPGAPSLTGSLRAVAGDRRTVNLLGVDVHVTTATRVARELRRSRGRSPSLVGADLAGLVPGAPVRVLARRVDGRLIAEGIHLLGGTDRGPALSGRLESIEPAEGRRALVRVAGFDITADERTVLLGFRRAPRHIVRPRLGAVDQDDLQFMGTGRVGRRVALAGEVRLGLESEADAGLAADSPRQLSSGVSGVFGLAAQLGRVFAYVEAVGRERAEIDELDGLENRSGEARLGEAYLEIAVSPHLSLALGRQKFNETREWYYNRDDLDAARVLLDLHPFSFEGSVSRSAAGEAGDPRWENYIARAVLNLHRAARFEAHYVERVERTAGLDAPRHTGLRISGRPGRHLVYWGDVAALRGTRGSEVDPTGTVAARRVRGRALDVGLTVRSRVAWDPSFTLAYARGSGDATAGDGSAESPTAAPAETDGRFAQTGLQRNRGRFNGNVSFRYYGEALDPELSNLHITTLGVGLRPVRALSLDLVYHGYRQDVPDTSLYRAGVDVEPLGANDDIGREWDLVLGYEPRRWVELKLTAGRFRPGAAFRDPAAAGAALEPYDVARLQAKFRF